MNILMDDLPRRIGGIPINTDFRAMILFETMASDPEIPDGVKLSLALRYLYEEPVTDFKKAWGGFLWYYSGGEKPGRREQGAETSKRAYDFEVDANMIYAAFRQAYKIDLNRERLHWWEFKALFSALPESCQIVKIMEYRTMDLSGLKGEEKKYYKKFQDKYRLKPLGIEKVSLAAAEKQTKDRAKARMAEAQKWRAKQKG